MRKFRDLYKESVNTQKFGEMRGLLNLTKYGKTHEILVESAVRVEIRIQ